MIFKNALLKQGEWHQSPYHPNSWQIEASELAHLADSNNCPNCHAKLPILTPQRDAEGDTTHYKGNCPGCRAKLTVFND